MVKRLNQIFLTRSGDEWAKILTEEDIAYERLRHFKEVEHDEQAWCNGYLSRVTFRGTETVVLPNSPVQMDEFSKRPFRAQGPVGQDTAEVLAELGYSQDEVRAMEACGNVRLASAQPAGATS